MKPANIYRNKNYDILWFLGFCALAIFIVPTLFLLAIVVIYPTTQISLTIKFISSVLFVGILLSFSIKISKLTKNLFSKEATIVFDEKGIIFKYPTAPSLKLIPWPDIEKIEVMSFYYWGFHGPTLTKHKHISVWFKNSKILTSGVNQVIYPRYYNSDTNQFLTIEPNQYLIPDKYIDSVQRFVDIVINYPVKFGSS